MKKSWIILLVLITLSSFIGIVSAEVRINEVMADPSTCSDSDCEYIEIYTDTPLNLVNWTINDGANDFDINFYLEDYLIIVANKNIFISNFSINESKVIEWSSISLRNTNESVFLLNNSELTNNFTNFDSTAGISWQYCSGTWIEKSPTPGAENNCTIASEPSPEENTPPEPEIYLEVDWEEDEIVNGDKFEIKVNAFNLRDEEYNLKIWIQGESGGEYEEKIISDRYDEDNEEWLSSSYYVDNFFENEGNDTRKIELRIRNDYNEVYGDEFEICFKLEGESDSEDCKSIEILEKEKETETEIISSSSENITPPTPQITGEVIQLGQKTESLTTEDLKEENSIIYQSKLEIIKKYSIYAFAFFCVGLSILLGFHKFKE